MYIIEKLIKLYLKITNKRQYLSFPSDDVYNVRLEDIVTCRHTFMPIDSTGEILACSKCGYLVSKKHLYKKKHKVSQSK